MKLYHELAEYYYAIEDKHRDINDDLSLITSLLKGMTMPSLLDLGCGTGEHLHLLQEMGIHCTGIDNSEDMLRVAQKRFPDIKFVRDDMLTLDFFEDFDMVISLFGSFNYLINNTDVDKVLWNTWRALKPGGIALFEIWNAIPVQKIQKKDMALVSTTSYKNVRIDRERGFFLLGYPNKSIVEVNYNYTIIRKDGTSIIRDKHIMRAFAKDEIERFILNNGFIIKAFYSNTHREPYSDKSNRIIVHMEKQ